MAEKIDRQQTREIIENLALQLGTIIATRIRSREWDWHEENKRLVEVCLPPVMDTTIKLLSKGHNQAEVESTITQLLISMGAIKLVEETIRKLQKKEEKRRDEDELQGERVDDGSGSKEPAVCGGSGKCKDCEKSH